PDLLREYTAIQNGVHDKTRRGPVLSRNMQPEKWDTVQRPVSPGVVHAFAVPFECEQPLVVVSLGRRGKVKASGDAQEVLERVVVKLVDVDDQLASGQGECAQDVASLSRQRKREGLGVVRTGTFGIGHSTSPLSL